MQLARPHSVPHVPPSDDMRAARGRTCVSSGEPCPPCGKPDPCCHPWTCNHPQPRLLVDGPPSCAVDPKFGRQCKSPAGMADDEEEVLPCTWKQIKPKVLNEDGEEEDDGEEAPQGERDAEGVPIGTVRATGDCRPFAVFLAIPSC